MSNRQNAKNYRERLRRQLGRLSETVPVAGPALRGLLRRGNGFYRMVAGILLIIGGVFAILPVLGLWMIPLGLAVLAIDLPPIRPAILRMVVGFRRRMSLRLRQRREKQGR